MFSDRKIFWIFSVVKRPGEPGRGWAMSQKRGVEELPKQAKWWGMTSRSLMEGWVVVGELDDWLWKGEVKLGTRKVNDGQMMRSKV